MNPVTYQYKKNGVLTTNSAQVAEIEASVAKAEADGTARHTYTRNGIIVTDPVVIAEIEAKIARAERVSLYSADRGNREFPSMKAAVHQLATEFLS